MKLLKKSIALLCSISVLLCLVPSATFVQAEETVDTDAIVDVIDTSVTKDTIDIENLTSEDILGEDTSLRDEKTKHFQLVDGSMLAVSYPVSVHEQIDGEWIDIDNTLTEIIDADGDTVLQSGAQTMRVSFAADDQNGRLVTVENIHTDAQVSMALYSTNDAAPSVAQEVPSQELFALNGLTTGWTYENIYDDVDINYVLTGTTLKENIVVKNAAALQSITFALHCDQLTGVKQEDNSVLLQDADGNTVYTIPAPFMYDAGGAYCDDINVGLSQTSTGYLYTMVPSPKWMRDSARVYPVTLDPQISSDTDPANIHGAFIKESDPTGKYGGESYMWIGNNTNGQSCRGLLQFDLPEIKASDYVTGAYIALRPTDNGGGAAGGWQSWNSNYLDGSMVLEAHKVTSAWDESSVTWNTAPNFEPTVMDAVTLTPNHSIYGQAPHWTTVNVSDIAKLWYNGGTNNGVLFKLNNEGNHSFAAEYFSDVWMMADYADERDCQPRIYVQYRSKAGMEGAYSYTSASADTAGSAAVQLNSGNLVFSHGDLAVDGGSMPVAISHVYNTCNNTVNKGYGYGWRINYAQTVVHKTIGDRTYYAYTDADGTVHYFDITESKDEYKDGSGLELTLTVGDTVDIRTTDDVVYSFSKTSGRLGRVQNPYGKSATVTYNSYGRIKTITDGLSRTYTFTYANDMLESIVSPDGRITTFDYTDGNLINLVGHNSDGNYENNTYVYGTNRELTQAGNTLGDNLLITYKGAGEGARVATLTTRAKVNGTYYKKAYTAIEYGMHDTTVTDEKGRTVTYQFNLNGNTRSIYNDIGQAQYYRYYPQDEQNPNGEETYGPNKLEAASQTQWSAQNYLLNHSFESSGSWSGDGVIGAHNTRYEGNQCLIFANTADSDSKITSQTVTLTKGETYTASAYVHSGDSTQVMMFADYGASTADYGVYTTNATNGWTRIQFTFKVPSNATTASVRLGFKVTGRGTAYIDGVQLEKSTTANRYNLLQNGDFTRDAQGAAQPTGWTVTASSGTTAGVDTSASGQTAFGLSQKSYTVYPPSVANSNASQVFATAELKQSVPVKDGKKGTTFSYGAWMKANSLPDPVEGEEDNAVFGVTVKLYNGSTEVQTQFTPANRFCPDWQFVGEVIVAKQAFDKAEIILEYKNNCNRAYFDGAYLYRDYFGQSFTYDDDGNVISTSAYADQNATFEYTPDGDLATSVMTDGASFEYTYNDYHAVLTGTSAEGVTSGYSYDESASSKTAGQVKAAQTELGTARNYTKISRDFDSNNLLLSETVTDVRGEDVKTYYNADGTVQKTVDAAGITTAYAYNHRRQTTAVTATAANGATLSTITYVYDSRARLSEIHNGDVKYFFTYDNYDRVVRVSVGTSPTNAVALSENTYVAATNGVASALVEQSTYGNGDYVHKTYDDRGRVIGVRYEGETSDHYTYSYDNEGNRASLKNNLSGQCMTYHYDLNKRLSEIRTNTGYGLRYEYDAGNALVGVVEVVNGVENSARYVYNKDDVMTQVQSENGTVQYDYSYNRRASYVTADDLRSNTDTLGFPTNKTNISVKSYDASLCPVPSQNAVSITRNGSTATISNGNAYWARWLTGGERYVMSVWYQAKNGVAEGDLVAALSYSNGTTEVKQEIEIIDDGGWHYAEFVLTANAPVYSTKGDYVTPCLRWTTEKSTGILNLNGLSFSHESETVVMPADLGKTISTYNATDTAVDDDTAPMPSTQVREWSRAANKSGWVYLTNKELATSTPQVGEVWEATFSAKTVSGSGGTMLFRFRQCDENGAVTSTDASTSDSVALTNDGAWHTYKLYVTVSADAYENYGEIVPRFGWASANTAGTVRVNGLTVRKVGDQWCEALGVSTFQTASGVTVETVDSTNRPIAYTNTLKLTNTSDETVTIKADNAQFLQWQAGNKWKISFWANTPVGRSVKFCYGSSSYGTIKTNGQWKLYSYQFSFTTSNLSVANVAFEIPAGASVYVNAPSIVPGSVVRANESYQNSAALKNITIKTGSATFNTAIEYDTDVNHYAYSRVKHYIVNGKAYSYEYDEAGNIAKITDPNGDTVTYEYDALNQLKAEHYSLPCVKGGAEGEAEAEGLSYDTIEYTYDTRGNILSKTYLLGETVVADDEYDYADSVWKDRLTEYNDVEITYDTIGNPLLWHDGATMSWQKGRQLASYTKNGVETAFTYDVDGIRRSKTTNGVKTEYNVYDGTLRSLTSGSNTMRFVYGNGLSSVIFNGTEYWYVFNAQGDVIGLIDASGSYVVQYTYDAWGKIISQTDSDLAKLNPFRYRGYIYDEETGLYYCQMRYYDPEIGRWLNADIYFSSGVRAPDQNAFRYGDNSPVNTADYNGEDAIWLQDRDGVWSFGHTGLLIEDEYGNWYHYYFGASKKAVNCDAICEKILLEDFVYNEETFLEDLDNALDRARYGNPYILSDDQDVHGGSYEDHQYYEGDFTSSLEYIDDVVSKQKYSLFKNNCMQTSIDILCLGIDDNNKQLHKSARGLMAPNLACVNIYPDKSKVLNSITKALNYVKGWFW